LETGLVLGSLVDCLEATEVFIEDHADDDLVILQRHSSVYNPVYLNKKKTTCG